MTLKFKIFSMNRRRFSNLSMLVEVNFHETLDCHEAHNEIIAVSLVEWSKMWIEV